MALTVEAVDAEPFIFRRGDCDTIEPKVELGPEQGFTLAQFLFAPVYFLVPGPQFFVCGRKAIVCIL